MQFVQRKGVWLLIDETAPEEACVIATLRNEVEVLALGEFCRLYLQNPGGVPECYSVRHGEAVYSVTPLGAPGETISLIIRGDGGSSTVTTAFRMTDK